MLAGVTFEGSRCQNPLIIGEYVVISQNKGPQYKPPNTTVLIIGTPIKVRLILGNYHVYIYMYVRWTPHPAIVNKG